MSTPLSVFVSYSHQDERYRQKLINQMASLQYEQLIAGWHDRLIAPGSNWDSEVRSELEAADIVLLLISDDFIASKYCIGVEANRAVERWRENKTRVIPVILRAVDWKMLPLGQDPTRIQLGLLTALPRDGKPVKQWDDEDEAFMGIVAGLRAVINDILEQRAPKPVQAPTPPGPAIAQASDPAAAPAPVARDVIDVALDRLAPSLESDSVTWFIGPRAADVSRESMLRPAHLGRSLFADLGVCAREWTGVMPTVDVAASYYAAARGATLLVEDVSRRIGDDGMQPAGVHRQLAAVLAAQRLRAKKPERRAPTAQRRNPPLVVTTCIDLRLEHALIAAGVTFTRIVQYHAEPRLDVAIYRPDPDAGDLDAEAVDAAIHELENVPVTPEPAGGTHTTNQNALESLSLAGYPAPILYKLRGSIDLQDSCMISTEQHLDFVLNLADKFIPSQIRTIVQHTPGVFLGFGYLETDFRLLYYTFQGALTDLRKEDRKLYSLQVPPRLEPDDSYRNMEQPIWEELKESGPRRARIATLEGSSEQFLIRLMTRMRWTQTLPSSSTVVTADQRVADGDDMMKRP